MRRQIILPRCYVLSSEGHRGLFSTIAYILPYKSLPSSKIWAKKLFFLGKLFASWGVSTIISKGVLVLIIERICRILSVKDFFVFLITKISRSLSSVIFPRAAEPNKIIAWGFVFFNRSTIISVLFIAYILS